MDRENYIFALNCHFLARYEDAESAPKRTNKHAKISKNFLRVIPRTPVLKGEGRARERRGGEGRGGEVLG
jgi:hypothetical protein